jgi:hypothetical protein
MTGLITLAAASDNVVIGALVGASAEFYNLVVSDTAGTGVTVDLFLSDDATSAAGERIDQVVLGANETKSFLPVGVQAGKYLLAKPTVVGAVMHGEYIYRNGSEL